MSETHGLRFPADGQEVIGVRYDGAEISVAWSHAEARWKSRDGARYWPDAFKCWRPLPAPEPTKLEMRYDLDERAP
jgi:hypothetical protein